MEICEIRVIRVIRDSDNIRPQTLSPFLFDYSKAHNYLYTSRRARLLGETPYQKHLASGGGDLLH